MSALRKSLHQLEQGDVLARTQAIEQLLELGDKARSALVTLARDQTTDPVVRSFAASALPRFPPPAEDTRFVLEQLLEDEQTTVVVAAAKALGMLGDPAARTALEGLVEDSREDPLAWWEEESTVKDVAWRALHQLRFAEIRRALASSLRERRQQHALTQDQVANLVGSSQSRVAKMEAADHSVSMDLLVRSHLALGATQQDLANILVGKVK